MRRIVLVYGLIAGGILGAMFFITAPLWDSGVITLDNGMFVGYGTMVVSLSLVFFGVKSYRDNHKQGVITFGQGFKVGILITLIACALYALSWEVAYHTVSKGFSEEMEAYQEKEIRKKASNETELKEKLEAAKKEVELYKSSFIFRFMFSFLFEVFPVGLLITLITAALLRNKNFLPASEPA
ncbi:MAG: DUF4199 domain-containing protein [Cyclobacteriaceae bacterium]|jgi:hypothetical protein|nr:DUF4199 domain-containing protein [Cyclobacteriaceae bacterium]